jgi:hypothetical protein
MTETIANANAAASTLFLGHNGEWWDSWLIVSGIAAALAAAAIAVTAAGSIISHKREARSAEKALEQERSARLLIEERIAERSARPLRSIEFPQKMHEFAGMTADIVVRGQTLELDTIGQWLFMGLVTAGWHVEIWRESTEPARPFFEIDVKSPPDDTAVKARSALFEALKPLDINGFGGAFEPQPQLMPTGKTREASNAPQIRIFLGAPPLTREKAQ